MSLLLTTVMIRSSSLLRLERRMIASTDQLRRTLHDAVEEVVGSAGTTECYKLLIVGGGTAGSTVASKFASKLGKRQVAIIEPSKTHYYQPMFTLVGCGLKHLDQTHKPTGDVLPGNCDWLQTSVAGFCPSNNVVSTTDGRVVKYDYLVIALGIHPNFSMVKDLPEALEQDPAVCTIYHQNYVQKTFLAMQDFKEGNAIFTFPDTPIKCAGAPQKILYLTEDYFRRVGKRDTATVIYNTSLGVVFGVPKYAQALHKQMLERDIKLNLKRKLVEVRHETKEAIFEVLGTDGATETYEYGMLHVAPPCSTPSVLWDSEVSDKTGFVEVDKETCQHVRFPNIFALGDCSNLPTSKTAAAISSQSNILTKNLTEVMANQKPSHSYNGYTSCPLVTKKGGCIMAEFGYDGKILETFPFNQAVPRRSVYLLKVYAMPLLYWYMLLKGYWNGPSKMRKVFHLWFKG